MSTGRTAGWAIAIAGITAAVSEAIRLLVEPLRFGPLGTAIVAVVTAVVVEAIGTVKERAAPRRPVRRDPYGGHRAGVAAVRSCCSSCSR